MNTELKFFESFDVFLSNYLIPKIIIPKKLKHGRKHRYFYSATKNHGPFIGDEDENQHWIKWAIENAKEAENVFDKLIMKEIKSSIRFIFYSNKESESVVITKVTSKNKKPTGNRAVVTAQQKTDKEKSNKNERLYAGRAVGESS